MYRPVIKNQWIKDSIQDSFSGMYLTVLSIIQGVALSLLISKVFDIKIIYRDVSTYEIEYLLMCLLMFLIIIVLWHSYFWLAVVAAWTPLIWDSLFMFSLGAIEFIAIKSIGSIFWFYAVAFIGIFSGLQYHYNVSKLPEEVWDDDTKEIGNWIRKYKKERGWYLFGIGIGTLIVTVLSHKYSWLRILLFVVISAGLIYAIFQHRSDQKKTLEKLAS